MIDNTQRALGELNGKMDMLISIVQEDHQEGRATSKRLERIELRQEEAARERKAASQRMDKVAASVDDINRWRERGKGAIAVVSAVAAVIGGGIAAAWGHIAKLFN